MISIRQRELWWLDTFNAAVSGTLANFKDAKIEDTDFPTIAAGVTELAKAIANAVHGAQNDSLTELP